MKTAVEQLQEYLSISLGPDRMRLLFNEFEKAKKMEKEQIIKAHTHGWNNAIQGNFISSQEYYNETFKSE